MVKTAIGVLLIIGVVFSIRDYKIWRSEETRYYGQGVRANIGPKPETLKPEVIYQNNLVGLRIKHPTDWQIVVNPDVVPDGKKNFETFFRIGERIEIVDLGGKIKISLERSEKNITDFSDWEASKHAMSREKEYINTDHMSGIVLTWKLGGSERQTAIVHKKDDRMFILEQEQVGGWEEILKSIVII
ncbi:MAG: hypothetical protein AAB909_05100 [Patescibacteria group bacterium]